MTTNQPGQMTQRAQKLPAPVPGQEVTIPLELLPIYMAAHRLEAMTRGDAGKLEERTGQRRAPDTVWVRRQKDE